MRILACSLLLACGAAPAQEPAVVPPATPTAFVAELARIATGAPGAVEEHVDAAFAARLPSGVDLRALLAAPADCTPTWSEGPGYVAIAIPPPMVDDTPEEAARIQAIIDVLEASIEVTASCGDTPLYTIAVRSADGSFVALAWRDFRSDRSSF